MEVITYTPEYDLQYEPVNYDKREEHISFDIDPKVLYQALREVTSAIQGSTQTLFFAVSAGGTGFYSSNMIAENPGEGRLVIGNQGYGRDHKFVDVPVRGVQGEGLFLFNEAAKLIEYASKSTETVNIEHVRELDDEMNTIYLLLRHGSGSHKKMPIRLFYDQDSITQYFIAHHDRFVSPTDVLSDDLTKLLHRAQKLAPAAKDTSRTGDFLWRNSSSQTSYSEGESYAEFVTLVPDEKHTITSVQKVKLPTEYSFDWEPTHDHLKALASALKSPEATYRFVPGSEEEAAVFQVAYHTVLDKDKETFMYIHRQIHIDRKNPPHKSWMDPGKDDTDLFEDEACKRFVTVPSKDLFNALSRIWAVDPSNPVTIERAFDSDGKSILELLSGDVTDPDKETVIANHGDSQISSFIVDPSARPSIEALIDASENIQIRSFPDVKEKVLDNGEVVRLPFERSNGIIFVPIDEQNPTLNVNNPDRYLIISWVA